MRKILVEDMRRPKALRRPEIYRYPLPELAVLTASSDEVAPGYESVRLSLHTSPSFLLVCQSKKEMPTGSVRFLLSRANRGFADYEITPAFKFVNGYDYVEIQPVQVSTLGTGSVFAFGTQTYVDFLALRIFWPVESFALFLLTPEELLLYGRLPVEIFPPVNVPNATDPVLADDFEKEADNDLIDDFEKE
jgi:hypothetical protein